MSLSHPPTSSSSDGEGAKPNAFARLIRALTWWDWTLIGGLAALTLYTLLRALLQPTPGESYLVLRQMHYWISRAGLVIAAVMLIAAVYIGVIRKGDVTTAFRFTAYAITALMLLEVLIGAAMYFHPLIQARPYDEVHLIYGMGALLALPFFIYVETTARKRPAMGSYIWGFAMLAAILVRSIMTGAAG